MKQPKSDYLERYSSTWTDDSIRCINTPSQSIRNTFFYVQETGMFKTFPPYFTERAGLNSFLIVYTTAGRGLLRYRDSEYVCLPGEAFYINCQERHYYECAEQSGWNLLWLHFNGNGALGYYQEFVKSEFSVIHFEDPFLMESTMYRILSLTMKKDVNSELICSSLIVSLLTELLLRSCGAGLSLASTPQYIKDAVKYMDVHFKESVSLDVLQKEFNISKYHMAREFKRYVGKTINRYLIDCRLNYAKELLRFSNLSINEIAFTCGMNNVSHFIGLFRDAEGVTPHVFRKEWTSL